MQKCQNKKKSKKKTLKSNKKKKGFLSFHIFKLLLKKKKVKISFLLIVNSESFMNDIFIKFIYFVLMELFEQQQEKSIGKGHYHISEFYKCLLIFIPIK